MEMEVETSPKKGMCLFCKESLEGSSIPVGGGGEVVIREDGGGVGGMGKAVTVVRRMLNQSNCADEGCEHPVCKLVYSLSKLGMMEEVGLKEDMEATNNKYQMKCDGDQLDCCERCSKVMQELLELQNVVDETQEKQHRVLEKLNLPSHPKPEICSSLKGHPRAEVEEVVEPVDTEDLLMSLVAVKKKLEKERSVSHSLQRRKDDLKATLKEARYIFEPEFRIWERKWSEQKYWMEKIGPLKETVWALKREAIKNQQENVAKDEEVRRLQKRVEELRKVDVAAIPLELLAAVTNRSGHLINENVLNSRVDEPREPTDVFPEEVWSMILENLTDAEDFVRCSKTCALFYRLLQPTRTTWMFKQVFPVLWKYLSGSEILQCREVCRSWRVGVDDFFENHISRRPHSDEESNSGNLPFVHPMAEKLLGQRYIITNNSDDIRVINFFRKMSKMQGASWSPIIGRALKIIEYDEEDFGGDEKRFWKRNVQKLLESFGKHIWYLTIYLLLPSVSSRKLPLSILKFLTVDIFLLVPNLRKLSICCHASFNDFGDHEEILENLPSINAPYLETLQLEYLDSTLHQPILENPLSRYHHQLQRLHLKAEEWSDICLNEWPELKELHLEKMSDVEDFDSLLEMHTPRLNKLGFGLTEFHDWTFDSLLNVIIWLSSTCPLNTVRLSGAIPRNVVTRMRTNLYAPSELKTLEVEHSIEKDLTNYEFLSRFPFLENVHLFCRKKITYQPFFRDPHYRTIRAVERRSGSEVALMSEKEYQDVVGYKETHELDEAVEVNQYLYYDEMYDSNVWEMLPRLKVFSFNHRKYTREGCEAYQDRIEDLPYKRRMRKRLTMSIFM